MGWKEAINTYPSSIVYEIHDRHMKVAYSKGGISEGGSRLMSVGIYTLCTL
jgi:hypothetical protein